MEHTNPHILVEKIANLDRQAEAVLVAQYGGQLRTVLRAKGLDSDLVDDLFQETFIIVLNKLREGQLKDPLDWPDIS